MDTHEPAIARRNTILQAAISCFIRKGFHATSMRDIAQASSVSLGNLYNYFPGKDALIAEVANQEQTELQPLRHELEQMASPTLVHVQGFLSAYAALCCQKDWAILSAECLSEIARNPALAPKFDNNRQQLLQTLAHALDRGASKGVFSLAAPACLIAQTLLDAVESEALRHALSAPVSLPESGADSMSVNTLHPGILGRLLGTA